jgi:hypothetical protein
VAGRRARRFCEIAGVVNEESSRRVQRALTDFGADEAFATAAQKFKEHYGVEVSVHRARQTTYEHARRMEARTPGPNRALPARGATSLLAEADGCLVPTVNTQEAPPGADRRKHRKTEYKQMCLVAARDHDALCECAKREVPGDLGEAGPARAALRYLETRREQLDYPAALPPVCRWAPG